MEDKEGKRAAGKEKEWIKQQEDKKSGKKKKSSRNKATRH